MGFIYMEHRSRNIFTGPFAEIIKPKQSFPPFANYLMPK